MFYHFVKLLQTLGFKMKEMVPLERIEKNHLDKVEDFSHRLKHGVFNFFLNSLGFNQFSLSIRKFSICSDNIS